MSGIIGAIIRPDRPFHADYTNDVEHGTSGNDTFYGWDYWGIELHGGLGDDTYHLPYGASGNSIFDTGGIDSIEIDMEEGETYTMPAGIENLSVDAVWEGWLLVNVDWTDGTLAAEMKGMDGVTINGNALANDIDASDLADKLYGNDGNDSIGGSAGNDSIWGGNHHDMLWGGGGHDYLAGGSGNDEMDGGTGNDRLFGQAGNDTLDGDTGADTMTGGTGNDVYHVDATGDRVVEVANEGFDEVISALGSFDLSGLANVEHLTFLGVVPVPGVTAAGIGNELANRVTASSNSTWIEGRGGFDLLTGGSGNDTVHGGDGHDTINGGSGADSLRGDLGDDSIAGGQFNDWIDGGVGQDRLQGDQGNDIVFGQAGHDTLLGGEGNDLLYGHADNDRVEGGAGRDTLLGGQGVDQMWGNAGADIFRFSQASDSTTAFRDTVWDFTSAAMSPMNAGERDRLDLSGIDANTTLAGNQAFAWTGTGAFFKSAGDLWIASYNSGTFVRGDTNGDAVADFEIYLVGTTGLAAADIIL